MRFEWDDLKAFGNLEKHGVSFGEATEVFYDPNALEGYDLFIQPAKIGFYHRIVESETSQRSVCGGTR